MFCRVTLPTYTIYILYAFILKWVSKTQDILSCQFVIFMFTWRKQLRFAWREWMLLFHSVWQKELTSSQVKDWILHRPMRATQNGICNYLHGAVGKALYLQCPYKNASQTEESRFWQVTSSLRKLVLTMHSLAEMDVVDQSSPWQLSLVGICNHLILLRQKWQKCFKAWD